jgi:hypothetical protein
MRTGERKIGADGQLRVGTNPSGGERGERRRKGRSVGVRVMSQLGEVGMGVG